MKIVTKILFKGLTEFELANKIREVVNGGDYHIINIYTNKTLRYNNKTTNVDTVISFDLEIEENGK